MSDSSIRLLHWVLSGAFKRAVRWKWLGTNPIEHAQPPEMPRPNPQPPTVEDAARIIDEAFSRDTDWGSLVRLAMTIGARRGELCALRWSDIDLETGTIQISRAIYVDDNGSLAEKDTKTHQQRRVVADPETVGVLRDHQARCQAHASALGASLPPDAFVFSRDPDGARSLVPGSVSQRYDRMSKRLDVKTTLHKLRHYSATELINAGVDVKTIAGRLGHGGGGATTLRVYTAWLSEADQRAAKNLSVRMPARHNPTPHDDGDRTPPTPAKQHEPRGPYERIAADLRGTITFGALGPGDSIPPVKDIAARYGVSAGTAHRALTILADEGLVRVSRGKRAVVTNAQALASQAAPPSEHESDPQYPRTL